MAPPWQVDVVVDYYCRISKACFFIKLGTGGQDYKVHEKAINVEEEGKVDQSPESKQEKSCQEEE